MLGKNSNTKNKDLYNYLKLLSEKQKIKLWIKTLISVQNNLPEIIKSVDKIIELNASSLSFVTDIYNTERSTYAQVEKVIDLTERKNKLLNIYLISKNILSSIAEEDRLFLKRKFVYNWSVEDLAQEYGISIRTVFRRTEKLIEKIYESISKKNWSLNFICLQVKNESWLHEKFNKFAKDSMSFSNVELNRNLESKNYIINKTDTDYEEEEKLTSSL